MSGPSNIEWTDATWNPVRGCTRVSEGCRHCYAERVAARFSGPGLPYEGLATRAGGVARWTGKLSFGHDLEAPLRWRRSRRIFVNSMSDLFHEGMFDAWIDHVFAIMALCPQHTFQVLTKRPERMRAYIEALTRQEWWKARLGFATTAGTLRGADGLFPAWPLPNVWLGTSCEDQAAADARVPELLATPAAVRFVSAEPLLGPIDFRAVPKMLGGGTLEVDALTGIETMTPLARDPCRGSKLDWIIVGGESGPGARPMHPRWPRWIRDQCAAADVPFFFKQWGEWADTHPNWPHVMGKAMANDGTLYDPPDIAYPDGERYGEAVRANHDKARLTSVYRVGKKIAGRLLDGVEHNGMPQVPA